MTVSLKHSKVSAKADGLDTSLVLPSDWNAEHALTMATSRMLGRTTAGVGAVEELSDTAVRSFLDVFKGGIFEINNEGDASYTLVLTDRGKTLVMDRSSAQTLTIPTNSSVEFPTGTVIYIIQQGAGQVTVSPAGGVTLRSISSRRKISAQYGVARLCKTDTNTWYLSGDITA